MKKEDSSFKDKFIDYTMSDISDIWDFISFPYIKKIEELKRRKEFIKKHDLKPGKSKLWKVSRRGVNLIYFLFGIKDLFYFVSGAFGKKCRPDLMMQYVEEHGLSFSDLEKEFGENAAATVKIGKDHLFLVTDAGMEIIGREELVSWEIVDEVNVKKAFANLSRSFPAKLWKVEGTDDVIYKYMPAADDLLMELKKIEEEVEEPVNDHGIMEYTMEELQMIRKAGYEGKVSFWGKLEAEGDRIRDWLDDTIIDTDSELWQACTQGIRLSNLREIVLAAILCGLLLMPYVGARMHGDPLLSVEFGLLGIFFPVLLRDWFTERYYTMFKRPDSLLEYMKNHDISFKELKNDYSNCKQIGKKMNLESADLFVESSRGLEDQKKTGSKL